MSRKLKKREVFVDCQLSTVLDISLELSMECRNQLRWCVEEYGNRFWRFWKQNQGSWELDFSCVMDFLESNPRFCSQTELWCGNLWGWDVLRHFIMSTWWLMTRSWELLGKPLDCWSFTFLNVQYGWRETCSVLFKNCKQVTVQMTILSWNAEDDGGVER